MKSRWVYPSVWRSLGWFSNAFDLVGKQILFCGTCDWFATALWFQPKKLKKSEIPMKITGSCGFLNHKVQQQNNLQWLQELELSSMAPRGFRTTGKQRQHTQMLPSQAPIDRQHFAKVRQWQTFLPTTQHQHKSHVPQNATTCPEICLYQVVPGRAGAEDSNSKTTNYRKSTAYKKLAKCRNNEMLKLWCALTNKQMVVEMPKIYVHV